MNVQLYVDIAQKKLVFSPTNHAPFNLPSLYRQDTINLVITLLNLNPSGGLQNKYSVVDITALNLRLGIGINQGNLAGTTLALQSTWTKDLLAMTFTGTLSLNTVPIENLLADSDVDYISSLFEIVVLEGGNETTVFQSPVTIRADVIRVDAVQPSLSQDISALANAVAQILTGTDGIYFAQSGNEILATIRIRPGSGITFGLGGSGLAVDFGHNAGQAARGDTPFTIGTNKSIAGSVAAGVLMAEVIPDPNGGLSIGDAGLKVNIGAVLGTVADGSVTPTATEGYVIYQAAPPDVNGNAKYARYLWVNTGLNPRTLNGWNSTTLTWQTI